MVRIRGLKEKLKEKVDRAKPSNTSMNLLIQVAREV